MNQFVGNALFFCVLLLAHQHQSIAQTTTAPSTTTTDPTTTTTTAATTTSGLADSTVTNATSAATTITTTIASASSNSTDWSSSAVVSTDNNMTTGANVNATSVVSTRASTTRDINMRLEDDVVVRFSDINFDGIPRSAQSIIIVYVKSERYGLTYRLTITDKSEMGGALLPRTRSEQVFGVGVDSPTAKIQFAVDYVSDGSYQFNGFFFSGASLVLAPSFSFERETMQVLFAQRTITEVDPVLHVDGPVFNNTIATEPLNSFLINASHSQFAVESFQFIALLDRTPQYDNYSYEENYDGVIAGIVVGGICGSFLLVLCIIGLVRCITPST